VKVGDLICYNAAGMRSKTIGIYMGLKKVAAPYYKIRWGGRHVYLCKIFWIVVGEVMPRGVFLRRNPHDHNNIEWHGLINIKLYSGPHYHVDHGCFEIIKKSS
tara:strand:+ start:214 stop:522 length:309 start_codon:yes stop_codon:yes gene_type:complete